MLMMIKFTSGIRKLDVCKCMGGHGRVRIGINPTTYLIHECDIPYYSWTMSSICGYKKKMVC